MSSSSSVKALVDQFDDPRARYLNKRELGKFLDKSERSINRLMQRRAIPYVRIGGEIRFRLVDVERALARYTVKEVKL
jgi:predicted DNA-binding transcriptional regulator AlpA